MPQNLCPFVTAFLDSSQYGIDEIVQSLRLHVALQTSVHEVHPEHQKVYKRKEYMSPLF